MKRKILSLVATAGLTLAVATAAIAAKPIVPKVGVYEGPTSQTASSGGVYKAGLEVFGSGKSRRVKMNIGLGTQGNAREHCEAGLFFFRTAHFISDFPKGGLFSSPLAIRNGGFSSSRTYPATNAAGEDASLTAEISGVFKSKTKVVGTVSVKGPPQELMNKNFICSNGKATFTARYIPPPQETTQP